MDSLINRPAPVGLLPLRLSASILSRLPSPRADWQLALAIALFLVFADNLRFWQLATDGLSLGTPAMWPFALSLAVVLLVLHALPMLVMPGRVALRVMATLLLVIGAGSSHFVDEFGTSMNGDMMQNLLQTDPAESAELLSLDLVLRLALLGVLPAWLVWRLPVGRESGWQRLRRHAVALAGGLLLAAVLVFATSQSWAVFLREHRPLRSFLNPGAVVVNLPVQLLAAGKPDAPLLQPAGPLRLVEPHPRPRFVVVVVGETARAANFGLGGYARQTTPRLAERPDIVYFSQVDACGTSTAVSVPCLFSHLGKAGLKGRESDRYLNLLDLLQPAQVAVSWADNNAGCKGVCARVPNVQFSGRLTPGPECVYAHCFDSVLRQPVVDALEAAPSGDTLVVLHQIGSHGPAYHERIPPGDATFQPACRTTRLDQCSREEIVNAYDNTILYTDRLLADLVALLADPRWRGRDTALVYVSDHGESLGEQGLYLHGMPDSIAPVTQTHVPMLLWLSPSIRDALRVDSACLAQRAAQHTSHDALFHTVLGLFGRANEVYRGELDLVGSCSEDRPS